MTCKPEIVPLITDAATSSAAYNTLSAMFALKNSTNVMRLEEAFGAARKASSQTMGDWISYVKSLVSQLRVVSIVLKDSKVANWILNGLGREYESMKHALQARPQPLCNGKRRGKAQGVRYSGQRSAVLQAGYTAKSSCIQQYIHSGYKTLRKESRR